MPTEEQLRKRQVLLDDYLDSLTTKEVEFIENLENFQNWSESQLDWFNGICEDHLNAFD